MDPEVRPATLPSPEYPTPTPVSPRNTLIFATGVVILTGIGASASAARHESSVKGLQPTRFDINSQTPHLIEKPFEETVPRVKPNDAIHIVNGSCTTIRRKPLEITYGVACSDTAKAIAIESGYEDHGWTFSLVSVRENIIRKHSAIKQNTLKCGYIRSHILPEYKNPPRNAYSACRAMYKPLTTQALGIFSSVNCPDLLPGVQGCRDGTLQSKPRRFCKNSQLYGGYTTNRPSPLNILGTGLGGFSMPLGKINREGLRFRASIKLSSAMGKAAIVRSHEWGFVKDSCVRKDSRRGGTVSKLSPNQLKVAYSTPNVKSTYEALRDHTYEN